MTDRSQGSTKRPFTSQWVKETLTSKVFKLSHKSVAFRQIEQNGPFQEPRWSSMSALGTKGTSGGESLNGCIILSVAAASKGPFHTYRHLLLAFLQFLREAADGCHCFNKKLNRRGNADWRPKPFTLPNFCSVFPPDRQPLQQFALWAGGRDSKSPWDADTEGHMEIQITYQE